MTYYSILFGVMLSLVAVPLWCLGLRMITDYEREQKWIQSSGIFKEEIGEKKILWFVREYFLRRWPVLGKPVISCVACMPSIHGPIVMMAIWTVLPLPWCIEVIPCIIFVSVSSTFISGYWWKKFKG